MIEFMRIERVKEEDIDLLIEGLGGERYSEDDSKESQQNCDYILDNARIELKLLEEEPLDKASKQKKIAELFGAEAETVVIDPGVLSESDQRKYYRILETPIQNNLKKASKQLQSSVANDEQLKIAILINNGLSLLSIDEFSYIAENRAKNDTSGVDVLLVGGFYFYTDGFDSWVISPLEKKVIRRDNEEITEKIQMAWGKFSDDFMTRQILRTDIQRNKEAVQDVSFSYNDILYVKPPPLVGKKSGFYPHGRPRFNSTGIVEKLPHLSVVLPEFSEETYLLAQQSIDDPRRLQDNLIDYRKWCKSKIEESDLEKQPLIAVDVRKDQVIVSSFQEIVDCAANNFNEQVMKVIEYSLLGSGMRISLNYIHLTLVEIGMDEANDIAYIEHVVEGQSFKNSKTIVNGKRMPYVYAMGIAATHCIRLRAECVYVTRQDRYKWK